MKLHIMSDLHLEFADFQAPETDAEVVILAGDIGKGERGILWARYMFPDKEIIYIPGNHEFYGSERLTTLAALHVAADKAGIHLLDDADVVIKGVRFLGATLWTDFKLFGEQDSQYCMAVGQQGLNDFRVIHEGSRGHFSPIHSVELHNKSKAFLLEKLQTPFDGKTVVVTHHLPSKQSVSERFEKNLLSACFASDLAQELLSERVPLWIHGHTHDCFDYVENSTRVICNPRGYVTYAGQENFDFNPALVIKI
jgi:predicted phosphodiesterase